MKKRKKSNPNRLILTISLLAIGWLLYANASNITYSHAYKLYQSQKYKEAVKFFQLSSLLNPDDLDAYYYYAKSLEKLPMTYDVQRKLFELATNSKSGAAATIANERISKYRYFILTHSGANYIQQTPFQDKVLRWNPSSFPLKVYIHKSNDVPPYYYDAVEKAFDAWNKASGNYLKFVLTKYSEKAHIDFRFIDKDNSQCKGNDCKYVLAYTKPITKGYKLKKSDIRFSKTDNNNHSFTKEDIYLTSMHEIGHALGIMGHSFYENNLMYPTHIEDNSIHAKYHSRGITSEDMNTIKLLYALRPDITNTEFTAEETQKLIYPPIILGNKKEINNKKIEQAKQYIANAPNLPNGYMDLASAYYELGNYQESINNLYKALVLTSSQQERYNILYNMTITYFEARNYNNALDYAQMTANIHQTSEINALIAYLKFKLGNKEFGINELETILTNEPDNIDAAQYLIKAHLENNHKIKAGSVIKEIKRNNPDATSDPRIQQFGLLNLFFN